MNLVASNVLVDESGIIKLSDYIEFNNLTKFNTKKIINIHTKNMKSKIINITSSTFLFTSRDIE